MSNKVLIAYGTRYGATSEAAATIQQVLEKEFKLNVEVYTIKKGRKLPELKDFSYVIIGSGIKEGKWVKEAEDFLKNNDFGNKKVAVFISSGFAGEEDLYDYAREHFLDKVIEESGVEVIEKEAFGGRVPMLYIPQIHFYRILRRLPRFQLDNRNWERVEQFAKKVGKRFTEED